MKKKLKLDIFISHAWRFHDEWKILVNILDEIEEIEWRNFSVPWHDPALRPTNKIGLDSITNTLKSQIIPCNVCFFITDLFMHNSNTKWLELSQKFANDYKIPNFYTGIKNITDFKKQQNFVEWDKENFKKLLIDL